MKTLRYSVLVMGLGMAVLSSCEKTEEAPKAGTIEYKAPEEIMAGTPATFSDLTLNAASRVWTFEDGEPATSTDAEASVTFTSAGEKEVSLQVTFNNNTVDTKTFTVTVSAEIGGEIEASGLTPMGCIRLGESVSFNIANPVGEPDTYSWTFEGGTPATSTDAAPSVSFDTRDREMTVTCVIGNTANNVKTTVTKTFVVGNYPLRTVYPEYNYDAVSFEYPNFGTWNCYNGKDINNPFPYTIAEGGACGTEHCLKIDTEIIKEQVTIDQESGEFWADCFMRDCWGSNSSIEAGKKYEVSMWIKADHIAGDTENNHRGLGCIQIIGGWLENWMYDSGLGLNIEQGYKQIFGEDPQINAGGKNILEAWYTGEEEESVNMLPDDDWHRFSVEFTATESLQNVYPYFRVYGNWYSALYIDEVELNLIEE